MVSEPRSNLDILRSTAVLSVLGAHCIAVAPFGSEMIRAVTESQIGRFGVLLFFVHTSLVLMMSMERGVNRPSWASRFYIQRIFRIYPLSTLCISSVLACRIPPLLHSSFVRPSGVTLVANLALMQNLFPPSGSLSGPLWSLPFEVQMYAVLPAIFLFVRKYRAPGAALLAVSAVIVAIGEICVAPSGPRVTQFLPCFMGGVLAYAFAASKQRLPAAAWPPAIALILALYLSSGASNLAQWILCMATGLLIPVFRDIRHGFLAKAASLIARYSYGVYLCNMPLRWLCFERLSIPTPLRWISYFALVPIVSLLAYHAIEAPFIKLGRRLAHPQLIKGYVPPCRTAPTGTGTNADGGDVVKAAETNAAFP
jgi:peptidoglycan/LPS O-acetylase OafA/YrhL